MSLTKEAVMKKMKDENTVILDILPEDDFKKLHIMGSESFTFGQNVRSFLLAVEKKYGKEKFFITYCANRADSLSSRNAAFVLQEQGFRAEDYPGGIQEWSEAGLPIGGTEADLREAFAEEALPPTK
jgi:rhodanese-related sulfurtransferase